RSRQKEDVGEHQHDGDENQEDNHRVGNAVAAPFDRVENFLHRGLRRFDLRDFSRLAHDGSPSGAYQTRVHSGNSQGTRITQTIRTITENGTPMRTKSPNV